MSDYMDSIVEKLISSGMAEPSSIRGCSQTELSNLEQSFGERLPKAYLDFLAVMGHSAGDFMHGTDVFLEHLPAIRAEAIQLLADSGNPFTLSNTEFVFMMHQGFQFMFFNTTAGDDPPIYLFVDGSGQSKQVYDRFSDWLNSSLDDEISFLARSAN